MSAGIVIVKEAGGVVRLPDGSWRRRHRAMQKWKATTGYAGTQLSSTSSCGAGRGARSSVLGGRQFREGDKRSLKKRKTPSE